MHSTSTASTARPRTPTDLETAKAYFNKVPAGQQQNAIEQKCQIEGLNLRAP